MLTYSCSLHIFYLVCHATPHLPRGVLQVPTQIGDCYLPGEESYKALEGLKSSKI